MTRAALASDLGAEFDAFLFAPIGEERNGTLLSVLSALARLDIDPWQEAAKLAGLPVNGATKRLASLIAALPDAASIYRDPGAIAAKLVTLLPHRRGSPSPSGRALSGGRPTTNFWAIIYIVAIAIALAAQAIGAGRQAPAPAGTPHAPTSDTVLP